MNRVVNIDWLSLYCGCHGVVMKNDFYFKKESFGTPQFKEIYTVIDTLKNQVIGKLQRLPHSAIIPKDCAIFEVNNRLLYQPDFISYITYFCDMCNLEIRSISRLDVCADFNTFRKKIHPTEFIRRFLRNEYLKMGNTDYTIKGNQKIEYIKKLNTNKAEHVCSYIRFGERQNEVSSYLYNKTKELKEVKDKPYIRQSWEQNGLDTKQDIWRLEFSLANKQMKYIRTRENLEFRLDLDFFKTMGMIETLYDCCYRKYFDFRKNDGTSKKYRMQRVDLFDKSEELYKMYVPTNLACSNRMDKIVMKKLYNTESNLRCETDEEREVFKSAAYKYAESKDMLDYFYTNVMGWAKAFKDE